MGGPGGVWLSLTGAETGGEAASNGGPVSLPGFGGAGVGLSGMNAGGGVKAGQSGMKEGGAISTGEPASGTGRRALGVDGSGGSASTLSGGTGISGAGPGLSEEGVSRMGLAWGSTESFFVFLKPRKFFFTVAGLGGGVAGTSSAVLTFLSLPLLSLGSSCSFSLLPFKVLSLVFFSFPSLFSFLTCNRGFLLSSFSSLKTTRGATAVLPSRVWLMEVSREGRAPTGR